jgi:hypothetical protein
VAGFASLRPHRRCANTCLLAPRFWLLAPAFVCRVEWSRGRVWNEIRGEVAVQRRERCGVSSRKSEADMARLGESIRIVWIGPVAP